MAKPPKLKVFRTAIGFHDAYVAARSRAAALRAWGSDKDLFARGAAEEVFDAALVAEPLGAPGIVIKRLRGTAAEQLAALPPFPPRRTKPKEEDAAVRPRRAAPAKRQPPAPAPPPRPKPSRAPVEAAEAALAEAKARQAGALAALAEREAALARERRALEREQASELRRLTRDLGEAAERFDAAMRRWRGQP